MMLAILNFPDGLKIRNKAAATGKHKSHCRMPQICCISMKLYPNPCYIILFTIAFGQKVTRIFAARKILIMKLPTINSNDFISTAKMPSNLAEMWPEAS